MRDNGPEHRHPACPTGLSNTAMSRMDGRRKITIPERYASTGIILHRFLRPILLPFKQPWCRGMPIQHQPPRESKKNEEAILINFNKFGLLFRLLTFICKYIKWSTIGHKFTTTIAHDKKVRIITVCIYSRYIRVWVRLVCHLDLLGPIKVINEDWKYIQLSNNKSGTTKPSKKM